MSRSERDVEKGFADLSMNAKGDEMHTGGCACGAIRYRITGACVNSMICHCQSCRRAAGAPVVPWLTFARSDVQWVCGAPREHSSSPGVRRGFCEACGTPLTYSNEKAPDTIDLTTCSLDDPNAFPPTHHSWLSHDLSWVKFGDGLPTFAEWRPE